MKVAIVHSALGRFGGGEIMTCLHGIYLKRLGHEVEIFYGGPMMERWRERTNKHIQIRELPFPFSIESQKKLIKLPSKLKSFDVILFHHHVDPFIKYFLTSVLDKKIVWYCGEPMEALWNDEISERPIEKLKETTRATSKDLYGGFFSNLLSSDFLYKFAVGVLKKLDFYTTRSFDKIITNSRYTKNLVRKVYGLADNVTVVYPGIEKDRFKIEKCKNSGVPIESDYMMAIGPFQPLKNYTKLIKAYSLLHSQIRKDNKLVILGEGILKKKIEKLASDLGVRKDVKMPGFVSEDKISKYYSNCKFLLHLAVYETFGLTPLEAALFEKPTISSDRGGPSETIEDGKTGILVDIENPQEIAKAMMKMIKDDNFRINSGRLARKRVLEKFSIEQSTQRLASELELII